MKLNLRLHPKGAKTGTVLEVLDSWWGKFLEQRGDYERRLGLLSKTPTRKRK
jgi:hypothetical protein